MKDKIIDILLDSADWFEGVQEDLIHKGKFQRIANDIDKLFESQRKEMPTDKDLQEAGERFITSYPTDHKWSFVKGGRFVIDYLNQQNNPDESK